MPFVSCLLGWLISRQAVLANHYTTNIADQLKQTRGGPACLFVYMPAMPSEA